MSWAPRAEKFYLMSLMGKCYILIASDHFYTYKACATYMKNLVHNSFVLQAISLVQIFTLTWNSFAHLF